VPEATALFRLVRASGGGTPLLHASAYAPRQSRGGNGDADAALGEGAAGPWATSTSAYRRRAGPRQPV
jgi:hypothetical protein